MLYAGLMLTPDGPKVLEFNVRFGDPRPRCVLPRLAGDLAGLLAEAASGVARTRPPLHRRTRPSCVVMASEGYPRPPGPGDPSTVSTTPPAVDGVTVFHAGAPSGPSSARTLVTSGVVWSA